MGNPLDIVSKLSEARESEKRLIKVFKDQKSSEIFLVSSGSFGKWRKIRNTHRTCGRISQSQTGLSGTISFTGSSLTSMVKSMTSAGNDGNHAIINCCDISSSHTLPTNEAKAALEQAAESSAS